MIKAELVSIVGSPLATGCPQVLSAVKQNLICSLAIKGDNAKNIGQEVAEEIKRFQFESVSQLHNFILDLLTKLREQQAQLQLALLWLPNSSNTQISKHNQTQTQTAGQVMVLATYQGEIILKRKNKIGIALQSDTEIKIIQGLVQDNDELVLLTAQSTQIEQSLRQLFQQSSNSETTAAQLDLKMRLLIDSSLTSIGLLKLKLQSATDVNFNQLRNKATNPIVTQSLLKKEITNSNASDQNEPEVQTETKTLSNSQDDQILQKITDSKQDLELNQDLSITDTPTTDEKIKNDKDIKIKISLDPIINLTKKTGAKLTPVLKNIGQVAKKKFQLIKLKIKTLQEKKTSETIIAPDLEPELKQKIKPELAPTLKPNKSQQLKLPKIFNLTAIQALPKKMIALFANKSVYLETKNSKKILKIIFIIVVALALLAGGGFFFLNSINQQKLNAEQSLAPAAVLLDEAKQVVESDIILARDKTAAAIEIIAQQQKELAYQRFTRSLFDKRLATARQFYEEISGMMEVSQLAVFFDATSAIPNFIISNLTINARTLALLDQEKKEVLTLDLNTQQTESYQLENIQPKNITLSDNQVFILGNGIHTIELDPTETQALQELKSEGDSDRDANFVTFFETYLYVFNPDKRNIFRYILKNNELSEPIGWLINKQNIKFDQVTSFAIDGRIWLTDSEGTIIKLERGEPAEFNVTGLEEPFGGSIKLFANSSTEFLYVLEPEKSRLVILSPEGEFIKQIASPSLASATQLVVNQDQTQAYAVSGSILYLVNLE